MALVKGLVVLLVFLVIGFGSYQFLENRKIIETPNSLPSPTPTQTVSETATPTPYPDTRSAIAAFLANKYQKPISEVKVTVDKEVPGYASGTVSFGEGGPGEVGAWLAVLGNGWNVVWDGNGNVDCNKMRQEYDFPDSILKPAFCN